jgi:hypothetical protein
MNENIDPTELGLAPRTIIKKVDEKTLAIVINRKSRIIMADGRKIAEKVEKILQKRPGMKVVLKVPNAPVCSKTLQYLESLGIQVIRE